MNEYNDWKCDDEVDMFGREAGPLDVLKQDIMNMLRTPRGSLLFDPDWGICIEDYLGKPLPSNLSSLIEGMIDRDDRVLSARVELAPIGLGFERFDVSVRVQVADGFLDVVQRVQRAPLRDAGAPPPPSPAPPPAPTFGSASDVVEGGGVTTVSGLGFSVDAVVWTDGSPRATVFLSPSQLTATVPAHAAGTVSVEVVQASGTTGVHLGALAYVAAAAAPVLVSVNYEVWHDGGGGQPIILTGTDLGGVTDVVISQGGTVSVVPTLATATTVEFVLPSGATGAATVHVVAPGGDSNTLAVSYWSPELLTDVADIFDAASAATDVVPDDDRVVSWDSVGGTWVAAGAQRPTLQPDAFGSGVPGIEFAGGQYLTTGVRPHTPGTSRSIMVVAKWTSATGTTGDPNFSVPLPLVGGSGGWNAFGLSAGQVAITSHSIASVPSGQVVGGAALNDGEAHVVGFTNEKSGAYPARLIADGVDVGGANGLAFSMFDRFGTSYSPSGPDTLVATVGYLVHLVAVATPLEIETFTHWAAQRFGVAP